MQGRVRSCSALPRGGSATERTRRQEGSCLRAPGRDADPHPNENRSQRGPTSRREPFPTRTPVLTRTRSVGGPGRKVGLAAGTRAPEPRREVRSRGGGCGTMMRLLHYRRLSGLHASGGHQDCGGGSRTSRSHTVHTGPGAAPDQSRRRVPHMGWPPPGGWRGPSGPGSGGLSRTSLCGEIPAPPSIRTQHGTARNGWPAVAHVGRPVRADRCITQGRSHANSQPPGPEKTLVGVFRHRHDRRTKTVRTRTTEPQVPGFNSGHGRRAPTRDQPREARRDGPFVARARRVEVHAW